VWAEQWADLTPMGWVGHPHGIASIAAFLSSDAVDDMTGSVVLVDGGYLAM